MLKGLRSLPTRLATRLVSHARRASATRLAVPLLGALALTACSDAAERDGGLLGPQLTPRQEIQDAARNNGAAGFYFVSPIAPTLASYPGVFDGTRSPTVQICVFSNGACQGAPIATYTMGAGITVDAASQLYRADWPTAGLPAGTTYRIRVLEGTNELGHADARRVSPGETAAALSAQGIVPLGNSSRLSIRFRIESNDAPVVTITSPANGAVVSNGASVTISGTATDPQEGDLANQIVYRSSKVLDPLGTGPAITVQLPGGRQTISASVTDAMGATTTTSIQVVVSIVSTSVSLNVPYAGTASLPITLSEPAPAGGIEFTVTSADPTKVGVVTGTVTIPAGAQSANATLSGEGPGSSVVTVSNADYGSASANASTTAQLEIVGGNLSFAQGRSASITVRLRSGGADAAAPPGGLQVALTPANSACAVATTPITIPAGLVSTTATVGYGGTASTPCSTTIVASAVGIPAVTTDDVGVSVQPAPALTFNSASIPVGTGMRSSCVLVNFGAPAPAGAVLTLTSADGSKALVASHPGCSGASGTPGPTADVTLTANQSSAYFVVDALENQTGTVNVTASVPGYTSATIPVSIRALTLFLNAPASTTTLSANGQVNVELCYANAAGTAREACPAHVLRPNGTPIPVTFTNSKSAVAELAVVGSGSTGQAVMQSINPGQRLTPSSGTGSVQVDPIGAGTTTISVSAPGLLAPSADANRVVTVSAPALTFNSASIPMGAGMRSSCVLVNFGAPAPAGAVLTLTSADASKVLVASHSGCSGAAGEVGPTADITLTAGQSSAYFIVDALENQSGTVTVTASIPGYTSATTSVSIRALTLFLNAPATTTTLSANGQAYVELCYANAAGTAREACPTHVLRPNGTPIPVTFTNSNSAVAELAVVGGSTGQSVTRSINPGQRLTPTSGTGSVQVDPVGAGTTTISVTAPGVLAPSANANRVLTVSAPALTFNSASIPVGTGMRSACVLVNLGAPAPAGAVLTLTSADASKVLVASHPGCSGASGAAGTTADVTLTAGQSSAYFVFDALENQSGTVNVTASVPGYTGATIPVSIRALTLYLNAPATSTTLSANGQAYVELCYANAAGTAREACPTHVLRPNGTPIPVTFTNSNSAVAELVVVGGSTGQAVTLSINPGQRLTPSSGTGSVQVDPIGAGTTTLAVTAPGVLSLTDASRVLTVSAPALTFNSASASVGLAARSSCVLLNFGAPAPAGTVLTLTSSNGTALQLASNPGCGSTYGAAGTSVNIALSAGQTSAYFVGYGGSITGTVTVTASAPGYTNGTMSFNVNP